LSDLRTLVLESAPDLDGGGPEAQAWWEAPCADTEYLGIGVIDEVTGISMGR